MVVTSFTANADGVWHLGCIASSGLCVCVNWSEEMDIDGNEVWVAG